MARDCVLCATSRGMERFEDEAFTIEHAALRATTRPRSTSPWPISTGCHGASAAFARRPDHP